MPPPKVEMSRGSHHPDTNGETMNRSNAANIVPPKRMLQNFCTKRLLDCVIHQAGYSPPDRSPWLVRSGAGGHLRGFLAFQLDAITFAHRSVRQHLQEIHQVPDL